MSWMLLQALYHWRKQPKENKIERISLLPEECGKCRKLVRHLCLLTINTQQRPQLLFTCSDAGLPFNC